MIVVKTFVVEKCQIQSWNNFHDVDYSGFYGCITHGEHADKFCKDCGSPSIELFKTEVKSLDQYIKIRWNYLMRKNNYDTARYTFVNDKFSDSFYYDELTEQLTPMFYCNIPNFHQLIDFNQDFVMYENPENPNTTDGFIILRNVFMELIQSGKFGPNAKLATKILYLNDY